MKKLFIFIFVLFASITVTHSQSSLEPCKTDKIKNETNCFGKFIFSNGDEYSGEVQNGMSNGQGIYIFKAGNKHEGEFKNNRPNGIVTSTLTNGDVYLGEQKDGSYHGEGTYTFANGDKYVGEYKDNKRHGQGTFTYADGKTQKGNWINNEFQKNILSSKEKIIGIAIIVLFVASIALLIFFFSKKRREELYTGNNPKINFIIIWIVGMSIVPTGNFIIFIMDKIFSMNSSILLILTLVFNAAWGIIILNGLWKSRVPRVFDKYKSKKSASIIIFRLIGMICFVFYLVQSSMTWIK